MNNEKEGPRGKTGAQYESSRQGMPGKKAPRVIPADIALFRILANRIPRLSAADPVEGARAIPEMLKAFEIMAASRLRSRTPRPVIVNQDLTEEAPFVR